MIEPDTEVLIKLGKVTKKPIANHKNLRLEIMQCILSGRDIDFLNQVIDVAKTNSTLTLARTTASLAERAATAAEYELLRQALGIVS
jgi:hypothetical protein